LKKYLYIINCQKIIFLSSAEVYGENIDNLNISESTICSPSSYYGLAKKNSEELLQMVYQKAGKSNLVIVRMPLVYGPRETQNIYGPSGFLQNAINNQVQTLWGDGSEKRNFLFIDDLIGVLYHIAASNFNGVINIANSESNTFRDIINELNCQKIKILLDERLRSKLKVDQGYDISLLDSIYPSHKSYSLKDGIEKILAMQKG
jgi:UDP-glucose 4-epimerase